MQPARASRVALRLALAGFLVLVNVTPVAARSVDIDVVISSPATVTSDLAVAYPVEASNVGRSTLNHVFVRGVAPDEFDYLGSTPATICSQTQPVCQIGQVPSGAAFPRVTFYYQVPAVEVATDYEFYAEAIVNEGGGDNSDSTSKAEDMFASEPIDTTVVPVNVDSVSGHSFPGFRTFSTGLTDLGAVINPHGSEVKLTTNAEVAVNDLDPDAAGLCPGPAASSCFGWGTGLTIDEGATIDGGIEVTMRWDASQLPNGMTPKKLKVIHIFDAGVTLNGLPYALITEACTSATQTHCFTVEPFKHSDKDIQATFRLPFNGIGRGWG